MAATALTARSQAAYKKLRYTLIIVVDAPAVFNKGDLIGLLDNYRPMDGADLQTACTMRDFVLSAPDFYKRSHLQGHVTASAWVVDAECDLVLLTHHAKIDRWLQLGGHIEGDPDIRTAAMREAFEECGLISLRFAGNEILDIDIHLIPASTNAPEHLHYDVRFLLIADSTEPLVISKESKSLKWVPATHISELTAERSVLRMAEKLLLVQANASKNFLPHARSCG